jgi:hypothetical protein
MNADLAARLSLLALLLHPVGGWPERPALLALAGAGLLSARALQSVWLWLGVAALALVRVLRDWPMSDSHACLLIYWSLALGLARASLAPEASLARNARLLIGLAFAFAALWKLGLSPDFLDGRFFQVSLIVDERLAPWGQALGGLDRESFLALRDALAQHADGPLPRPVELPALPVRLVRAAQLATALTAALETSLALAFLVPWRRLAAVRDGLLLAFCATSYALAPVEGFGWLLVAMGVAQCEPARRRTRWGYVLVFALIGLYATLPWDALLTGAASSRR